MSGEPAFDEAPLRARTRRARAIAAAIVIAGTAVLAASGLRAQQGRSIRSAGVRVNAVVLSTAGSPLVDRILIRYDVDDGSLLRADVAVPGARRYRFQDTVRAAYDRKRPARARLLGIRDPLPPVEAALGGVLFLAGAAGLVASGSFARRARRSLTKGRSSMRATAWRGRGGSAWVRVDLPEAPQAPAWWVPILPGQTVALEPGSLVVVHGTLGSRDPIAIHEGVRTVLWGGVASTATPKRIVEADGAFRTSNRPSRAAIGVALIAVLVVVAAWAYVAGPGQRGVLESRARRATPACGGVERLLQGRTSAPDAASPAAVDQTSILELPKRLLARPPRGIGFDGTPPAVDSFLPLEQAASTRRDAEEGRRVFRRYAYIGGYRRDWSAGGRLLTVFAYEFSSPANAAAFDAYANRYVCAFDGESFSFPDLPGAIGNRILTRSGSVLEQVSFVRGARRYLVGITFGGPLPGHADIHALAAAQAALGG